MLMLKRLNSVWKVLSGTLSLGFTYILSTLVFKIGHKKPFKWNEFSIICGISLLILAYASSKRDESKLLQLRADADRRLKRDS